MVGRPYLSWSSRCSVSEDMAKQVLIVIGAVLWLIVAVWGLWRH